jgi:hypothetical protein
MRYFLFGSSDYDKISEGEEEWKFHQHFGSQLQFVIIFLTLKTAKIEGNKVTDLHAKL